MLEYARKKATETPYQRGQQRVYAVITDKRGKKIAESSNSYCKSHPTQAIFAKLCGKSDKIYLHAEIAAMLKVRNNNKKDLTLHIARVDSKGNPLPSAPCEICALAAEVFGIKEIKYKE